MGWAWIERSGGLTTDAALADPGTDGELLREAIQTCCGMMVCHKEGGAALPNGLHQAGVSWANGHLRH